MTEVAKPTRVQMHVGGRWVDAESGASFESVSPATGEVLGVLPDAGREDARRAVGAAGAVSAAVAALPMVERVRLCHAVSDRLDSRREEVARLLSLEQGKPLAEAASEVRSIAHDIEDPVELETVDHALSFIGRFSPRSGVQTQDELEVAVQPGSIQIFDRTDGRSLRDGARAGRRAVA